MSFGEDVKKLVERHSAGRLGIHPTWTRVRLGDVADLTNGFAYKSANFDTENGTPLLRIRDILSGKPGTFYNAPVDDPKMLSIEDGDIAIGMDGDFNSRMWDCGKALINQRVCTLKADDRFYSQKLLSYALPGYLRLINDYTSSVTVKHLSSRTVQDIPLPLPPLNEQHRIVEKIETLFAQIEKGEKALREVRKLLKRYRQSILKAAVTGSLIGRSWQKLKQVPLGDLLLDIRYGTAKKCGRDDSKTPVLRIPNIVSGEIDLSDLKYTNLTERELDKLSLRRGDILIVRSNGSANLVARGAIVDEKTVGLAYAGYLIRLRIDQDRITPQFLKTALDSPQMRSVIELQARSTSGVHNINSSEIKNLSIPVPSLDEQIAVTTEVDKLFSDAQNLEVGCESELQRSTALRQSILKSAFTGQLVPQDPNDEPASKLLARIRAEREAMPKAKARRKARA